jgi:SlyX protein
MDPVETIERRLTALELKATYADDLLDELNQTIFRQQQQIESLARALATLRDRRSAQRAPATLLMSCLLSPRV